MPLCTHKKHSRAKSGRFVGISVRVRAVRRASEVGDGRCIPSRGLLGRKIQKDLTFVGVKGAVPIFFKEIDG